MAPKRQRRVVGTLVKTTRKVVEETLQVSIESGEGNGEQNHSRESKVVEVAVEEKKVQESQTSVPPLEDSQANEKAEEEETNKRKKESKEAPKEGAEEPPQRNEKQEKEGRGEGKDKEEPLKEEKQKKEGVVVEGEEKGKKRGRGGKRRRRRKRYGGGGGGGGGVEGVGGGYKRYVFRVLKQVHPGMGVSSRAMAVLDGMMADMFERLADEAARLSRYTGKATLSSREIQDAVRLVLPGELGRHAISEGTKAVSNYMSADHGT